MFQTAEGVSIPFPEKIEEKYQIYPHSVEFNLSFEKIKPMLLDFISMAEDPLFVALEMPLNEDEEQQLHKQDTNPFHKKVCYLDGQSKEQVLDIIKQHGDILLNDGISQFAVASHATNDDFFIKKYKLIDIYSDPPTKYIELLKKYGLTETSDLLTAWDTFSEKSPGKVRCVNKSGKNIYDVYQALVELGMYTDKVVED